MKPIKESVHGPGPKTYILVWVALFVLTAITVSVAGMNLGRLSISVALLIAAVKSGLVLNYFMHLSQRETPPIFKWMVPGILAVLVLFIGLTFFDVALR